MLRSISLARCSCLARASLPRPARFALLGYSGKNGWRSQSTQAAAPSSSVLPEPALPISSRSASRRILFDGVPTPLAPSLVGDSSLAQHGAFPASSVQEQVAILEVCLATGNLARAKKMFVALRKLHFDEEDRSASTSYGKRSRRTKLSDVVPPSLHTAFLRAMFRQALVHGAGSDAAFKEMTIQSKGQVRAGATMRKRMYVSEAWEWFETLLAEEHIHGRLDDSAWAVMFKGLVATKLANPPVRVQDPTAPNLKDISHLYSLLRTHRRSLENILREGLFSSAGLAGLYDHPALEVLDELGEVLISKGQSDAYAELDGVRQRLAEDVRYQQAQSTRQTAAKEHRPPAHDPLKGVDKLRPAKRSKREEVPFGLGSLLGNLDTITGQRQHAQDPYTRQDLLEESAYDAARWQAMFEADQLDKIGLGTDVRMKGNVLQGYMNTWLTELTKHLRADTVAPRRTPVTSMMGDSEIKDLLGLMDIDKIAFITVAETLRVAGMSNLVDGVKATRAIVHLGRTIEEEFGAEAWRTLYPDLYAKAMAAAHSMQNSRLAIRRFMQEEGISIGAAKVAAQEGYGDEADDLRNIEDIAERAAKMEARQRAKPWTQKMRAKVGGYLIKALMDTARVKRTHVDEVIGEKVEEEQFGFFQSYQFFRGNKIGVIKLNPLISARLDKDTMGAAVFPRYLPMLVPPKPWTKWNEGGYRIHTTEIMRTRDSPEQISYLKLASDHGHLNDIFTALDVLGSTAWQVNKEIFDVVMQVWNSGESLADIPMDNAEDAIPDPVLQADMDMKDPRNKEAYRVALKEVRNQRSKSHSQRCDLNYKLEIARAYLGETFYFPHNMDFRGRAYPIPPNLSHIGDDMSRGLLRFAESRRLGKRGLTWLHIQIANSFGFDKASFEDREQFTKDNLENVLDSAAKPLEGKRWWLKADDPWQCLAACKELQAAMQLPNPEDFESSLPVQQDGTCNGLQHYAALGGDQTGAAQVNLAPGEKPADVYTAVANMVNKEIEKDLLSAEGTAARTYSEVLKGKITRKVVKQTVMTTVYGVTFIGAKRQIQKQLKDRGDIAVDHQYGGASYLAEKVLSSIGDLFTGASAIQVWLSLSARLIGRAVKLEEDSERSVNSQFKEPMASVIWTTPLGLPVAQPYRKHKKSQVSTALQSVFINDPNTPSIIDPKAQSTAFPPNYIHSLDASHMMMTAIECKRKGLYYASVHDSYWTHACDVDEMAATLRDCFIKLHSQDLLGDLKRDFEARYEGFVVRQSPTVDAARKWNAEMQARMASSDRTQESYSDMLAKNIGAAALPPLALVADRKLLEAAQKASLDEESDEKLEDSSFSMEDATLGIEGEEAHDEETGLSQVKEQAPPPKKGRKPKAAPPKDLDAVAQKAGNVTFYNLADLIPTIPPKGDFDLERIRTSPYFFS